LDIRENFWGVIKDVTSAKKSIPESEAEKFPEEIIDGLWR